MNTVFTFANSPALQADTLVISVFEEKDLSALPQPVMERYGSFLARAMDDARFSGKHGQVCLLPVYEENGYARLALLGFGGRDKLDELQCESAGGKLFQAVGATSAKHLAFPAIDGNVNASLNGAQMAAHFCLGLRLRSYRFDKYKSRKADEDAATARIERVEVTCESCDTAANIFERLDLVAQGTLLARDLTSEPANMLNPVIFAERIREELKPLGVEVVVFDENRLEKLGMKAMLAVGRGSEIPPRMVVMHWNGSRVRNGGGVPVALVGKGITFDTGGISIKPSKDMELMKLDMGGAAAVAGVMKALALRKSKAEVVGVVGLAENMPDGKAYRPSDIVRTMSGKTVEIINTDAEGRLVLADCITYVQQTYKPQTLIDLATLTGSMMIALGFDYCGSFVNNDSLWAGLERASKDTGEKLWRMPLDEIWRKDVESSIADLKNLAGSGSYGGACTAAGFLEHFIEQGTRWAHLDVAGTAFIRNDRPTTPKGASGFGVRVLDRFIEDSYE